jgi:FkbM family methyltransferase
MKRKTRIRIKRVAQALLRPFRRLVEERVYTIRNGPAKGLKRKGGFGFLPFWADEEDLFFSKIDLQDMVVYDIGGNIGIMSILFAKKVGPNGHVLSFEPNPDCAKLVSEILKLNQFLNARVYQIAIGDKSEKGILVVHAAQAGTASLNSEIVRGFIEQGNNESIEVDVFPLDTYVSVNALPVPDFIKIDTEGYEYQCVMGMRNILEARHPQLFIEMHAISDEHSERNSKNIVSLLEEYNYKIYSIRQKCFINKSNYHLAKSGHIFCS